MYKFIAVQFVWFSVLRYSKKMFSYNNFYFPFQSYAGMANLFNISVVLFSTNQINFDEKENLLI